MKVLTYILFGFVCLALVLVGCQLGRGVWQGITDKAEQQTVQALLMQMGQVTKEAKETGTIDNTKSIEIMEKVAGLIQHTQDNKMSLGEFIGYVMGIAVGSYLATRKIRLLLTNGIRNNKKD